MGIFIYTGVFYSGGTVVTVEGTSLDIIRSPKMYLTRSQSATVRVKRNAVSDMVSSDCVTKNSDKMICTMPKVPESWLTNPNDSFQINYGFILDGIQVRVPPYPHRWVRLHHRVCTLEEFIVL